MPLTPTSELDLQFDVSLVSPEDAAALAERGLELRPLARTDYARGHLEPLADLTFTSDIGEEAWVKLFDQMRSIPNTYYMLVVVDQKTDRIVATGSVVNELKFIRGGSSIGHIEDIAVSKSMQGKRIGLYLIQALNHLSEKLGNYKCILDCNKENTGFYEKCGHVVKAVQMGRYVKEKAGARVTDSPSPE